MHTQACRQAHSYIQRHSCNHPRIHACTHTLFKYKNTQLYKPHTPILQTRVYTSRTVAGSLSGENASIYSGDVQKEDKRQRMGLWFEWRNRFLKLTSPAKWQHWLFSQKLIKEWFGILGNFNSLWCKESYLLFIRPTSTSVETRFQEVTAVVHKEIITPHDSL